MDIHAITVDHPSRTATDARNRSPSGRCFNGEETDQVPLDLGSEIIECQSTKA
jgi:hypothetical protein